MYLCGGYCGPPEDLSEYQWARQVLMKMGFYLKIFEGGTSGKEQITSSKQNKDAAESEDEGIDIYE